MPPIDDENDLDENIDDSDDVDEYDEDQVGALDRLLAEDISGGPMPGPGGMVGEQLRPEPIPEATPASMICLRGPCVHYLEIKSKFQAGNTKGTLKKAPVATNRFCMKILGTDIDMTDELPVDCNYWQPREDEPVISAARVRWLSANAAKYGLPVPVKE